jgi:hypothetical protein
MKWVQSRLHEVSDFCETFTALVNTQLPNSWGPLGTPGYPDEIDRVIQRLADCAQRILAWEEALRFTPVPPSFFDVCTLMSGNAGQLLDQLAKVYAEMSTVFAQDHPTGTYNISLTATLPDEWEVAMRAAIEKAVKALTK